MFQLLGLAVLRTALPAEGWFRLSVNRSKNHSVHVASGSGSDWFKPERVLLVRQQAFRSAISEDFTEIEGLAAAAGSQVVAHVSAVGERINGVLESHGCRCIIGIADAEGH